MRKYFQFLSSVVQRYSGPFLYRNFLVVLAFIGVNNQRVGAQSTGENFEFLRSETQLLVPMAKDILNHDSATYKFELNKQFGGNYLIADLCHYINILNGGYTKLTLVRDSLGKTGSFTND